MWIIKDLTGKTFGRWTVVCFSHRDRWGRAYWECKCECGNTKPVQWSSLSCWNSVCCWCVNKNKTHWKHWTPEHHVWNNMIQRCDNSKAEWYKNWWWRGITYDKKRKTFEWFREDVWPTYKKWLSLDRYPDTNWNYELWNVRRATMKQQCNNMRTNVFLEYKWMRKTIKEWSEYLWISYHTIRYRLKCNLPIELVLATTK